MIRIARLVLLGLLALAVAAPATALGRDPDAAAGRSSGTTVEAPGAGPEVAPRGLIVRYRSGTTAAQRSALRSAERLDLRSAIDAATELVRPRGRSLTAAATALRARPDVAGVALDAHRALSVNPTGEPGWSLQWGHHNTGQVVNGFRGTSDVDVDGLEAIQRLPNTSSVVVAVIDDGVDFAHPDLAGQAWVNPGESGLDAAGADRRTNGVDDDRNGYVDDVNGWDFCNDDNTVHDRDQDWHGTGVASTIAAPVNGSGIAGLAPGTRIMALKFIQNERDVLNPACGWDSMAIEAIAYAKRFGVRIINASWGGPWGDAELETAIETSGALFVAAAGNSGVDIDLDPHYPAAFDSPNIVTVAAIHNEGGLSGFSNVGRRGVDLSAPGEDIRVALPATSRAPAPAWTFANGTSFAAPYVSAIAALAGAARPSLLAAPTALRGRVLATATPLAATSGLTATGRLANARRAIDFTGPTLAGGISVLPAAATMGRSSVRVRLSWGQAVDDVGMGSYRVEQRRNAGAWTRLVDANPGRTFDTVIALGGTYEFRVSPRDALGNMGAPVSSRVLTAVRYDESWSPATYAGSWSTASLATATGGRTRYTTATNASVTFSFGGRTGAVVAPTGPTKSSFKVYVDGVYVRTISLYAPANRPPSVVFTTGTLASGTHRIKLVHARVGARARGDVDAFVVLR